MRISILVDTPPPTRQSTRPPEPTGPSIEEEIRGLIQMVESDCESMVEWKALQKFYAQLCEMKQSPRVKNLRQMIKPVLSKYGYHVE